MYTAPPSKVEYEHLIKILSSYDFSSCLEEDTEVDKEYPYQILEIRYNDQVKNIFYLPDTFVDELVYFMDEYIELRANINLPWWKWARILRRK